MMRLGAPQGPGNQGTGATWSMLLFKVLFYNYQVLCTKAKEEGWLSCQTTRKRPLDGESHSMQGSGSNIGHAAMPRGTRDPPQNGTTPGLEDGEFVPEVSFGVAHQKMLEGGNHHSHPHEQQQEQEHRLRKKPKRGDQHGAVATEEKPQADFAFNPPSDPRRQVVAVSDKNVREAGGSREAAQRPMHHQRPSTADEERLRCEREDLRKQLKEEKRQHALSISRARDDANSLQEEVRRKDEELKRRDEELTGKIKELREAQEAQKRAEEKMDGLRLRLDAVDHAINSSVSRLRSERSSRQQKSISKIKLKPSAGPGTQR